MITSVALTAEQRRDCLRTLMVYLVVSAGLHVVWEVLQLPLYTIWRTGTAREIAFAVLHCTGGDLMIAALSLGGAILMSGNKNWTTERRQVFLATMIFGLAYTIFSEWFNTVVRQSWTYSDLMPTLPILGTGISPFLQWLVIPSIALYLASSNLIRPPLPE
jgi:Mn2+/Fe2+ NRAMP family transporter